MGFCQFTSGMVLLIILHELSKDEHSIHFQMCNINKNVTKKYAGSVYLLEYIV